MRLSKLFGTVVVTAMAFAVFGANARAASGTVEVGPVSGGTHPFTVHINEPKAIPDAVLCGGTATTDPDSPFQNCGHVIFSTAVAGTLTASITFNTGPDGLNLFSLAFCATDPSDLACITFFDQTSPNCTFTSTPDNGPNTNMTITLTCTDVPAGSFELLVVPNFFSTCGIFDPVCSFAGADISGSFGFNPSGGTGTGGGTPSGGTDKVSGGGQVGPNNSFSVEGFEGSVSPKGQVRLAIRGGCAFRSKTLTLVVVDTPNHAHLHGRGIAKTASGQFEEDFDADAFDNGEGSSSNNDQFSLKSPHCSNSTTTVTSGNIQIHFTA